MPDSLKDFDSRTVMLERCSFFDGFLSDIGSHFGWSDGVMAKMTWKMAYRDWRANRRTVDFLEGQGVLVGKKSASGNCEMDWIGAAR